MPSVREDSQGQAPLVVDENETGLRVDTFLALRKLVPSSSAARRAVASGVVRVNGRVARKGLHLQPGDAVDMGEGGVADVVLVPTPELALPVLYVDEAIVAVAKPAGVPSHPLRPGEGATLAGALVARYPECAQASPDPREGGLGHRLDVGTSGVLLAARSRQTWHQLREALAGPHCEKVYLAEVCGALPTANEDRGEFVLPGPRPGSFVLTAPIGRQGRSGGRVLLASGREPLPARTEVALLAARGDLALVEAKLSRGRAHQVRAHLAHLGVPVKGDPIYGKAEQDVGLRLHAWSVSLLHPTTGAPLRVEAPPPAWVEAYSNWAMLVSTRR